MIAVDETKLKISGKQLFFWSAIDVKRYEVLAIKSTTSRTELETILFLKEALKYCLNRPIILVDHGPWYPLALEHLGMLPSGNFGSHNHRSDIRPWTYRGQEPTDLDSRNNHVDTTREQAQT